MGQEHDAAALRIIRRLTGGRWVWPPVEVREVYPLRTDRILLRGLPVREVVSVKDYSTQEDLPYTRHGRWLDLEDGTCRSGVRVDVTYRYGSSPPIDVLRAVDILSNEFALADAGDDACRLPDRVTSLTRQGISWSFVDPMTLIDRGRTGIYELDLILGSYGNARARVRVFSPEYPPPDRISVTELPVPVGG